MSKAKEGLERMAEDREMPHGRPAPGRRCIYCNEFVPNFFDPRFCSETCSLAYSEAHKRGFYSAECTRCGEPRSAHGFNQKRGALYTDYLCADDRPADFADAVGRAGFSGKQGNVGNSVAPFFSDAERGEMYRDSQAVLEEGEERWTPEEREDERHADEY